MKFNNGAISGELDEVTLRGVGSYPILPTLALFAAAFGYHED